MKSLVSICIPTYNGEQFVAEALQSVIGQTYPNLEIIVSDDASEDNTIKIIEDFKDKTSIPIKIYHHIPTGIGANWNKSIKHANGKYIKFLFQDDIFEPTCVEEMVRVIESDSKIGLVASKRDFIIEDSYLTDETKKWIETYGDLQNNLNLKYSNNIAFIDKKLFKHNTFLKSPLNKIGEPPVVIFKKDLIKKVGYFREDLKQILDYEFYYRVLKKQKIAIIDKKLVKFRLHKKQATNINRGKDSEDYVKYRKIIYKDYFWLMNSKYKFSALEKNCYLYRIFVIIIRKLSRIFNSK